MKTSENVRARNWTFITYPESVVPDWIEVLKSYHLRFCVSPLHDKDVAENGEIKKAHYHVIVCFTGKKNYKQVYELSKSVNGTKPEKVHEISAMVRYLVHLDDPDKYQYDIADIKVYGGFDAFKYLQEMTAYKKCSIMREIEDYISENHIHHIADIHDYARDNNQMWYEFMTGSFMVHSIIRDYIKSIWQRDVIRKGDYND